MVSGIRFSACSGIQGGITFDDFGPDLPLEIFAYNSSFQSSPNRIGFFGLTGAPASVIVGQYQQRTHRTNSVGSDLGVMINVKFTGASDAEVSGVPFPNIEDLPGQSGTILMRFREASDTLVVTQNGFLRAIRLVTNEPNDGLRPLNVDIRGFQAADTHGNAGDSTWTQMSDGAGAGSDLSLANQIGETSVHDWIVALSASPTAIGTNTAFAFLAQIEFL
jgi:hypothetical protein